MLILIAIQSINRNEIAAMVARVYIISIIATINMIAEIVSEPINTTAIMNQSKGFIAVVLVDENVVMGFGRCYLAQSLLIRLQVAYSHQREVVHLHPQ
jgi:hypothetical protein